MSDDTTIRAPHRRFARRQRSRRWRSWRRVLGTLLAVAALVGAGWLVFFSPVLAVGHVEVTGVDVLEAPQVRTAAAVPAGAPLARVDVEAVAARVQGLAPVREVEVSRAWPDTVRVAVTERVAVAVVVREGRFIGVDVTGVPFRAYVARPTDLPLLRTRAGTRAEALAEATDIVVALPDRLAARVAFIEVETVDAIRLRLDDGRTVVWGSAEQSGAKARVAEALLQREGRVYDVSVPGQPTLQR